MASSAWKSSTGAWREQTAAMPRPLVSKPEAATRAGGAADMEAAMAADAASATVKVARPISGSRDNNSISRGTSETSPCMSSIVLARLLQQQETHSRTRYALYTCRNCGTLWLSAQAGEYAKRYAHDCLRKSYVSKLAVAYERDLGITTDWSDAFRICNLIRRDLVTLYMTFAREVQKKSGVAVKQAPTVLPSHLHTIVSPLRYAI